MINTIYTFALGKKVNFGERINFIDTDMFLDFNRDVNGYGFKLCNNIDTNFDKSRLLNISIVSDNELNGTIEFKTNNPNETVIYKIKICSGEANFDFIIPKLSSILSEVVVYFPKKSNRFRNEELPSIRFKKISTI